MLYLQKNPLTFQLSILANITALFFSLLELICSSHLWMSQFGYSHKETKRWSQECKVLLESNACERKRMERGPFRLYRQSDSPVKSPGQIQPIRGVGHWLEIVRPLYYVLFIGWGPPEEECTIIYHCFAQSLTKNCSGISITRLEIEVDAGGANHWRLSAKHTAPCWAAGPFLKKALSGDSVRSACFALH